MCIVVSILCGLNTILRSCTVLKNNPFWRQGLKLQNLLVINIYNSFFKLKFRLIITTFKKGSDVSNQTKCFNFENP